AAFSSTVVVPALKSYNECIELTQHGLLFEYKAQAPWSLIISGTFRDRTTTAELTGATINNLTCSSTNFSSDGKKEVFDGSKKIPLTTNFSIVCQRTGTAN